jgi:hypothetical protein
MWIVVIRLCISPLQKTQIPFPPQNARRHRHTKIEDSAMRGTRSVLVGEVESGSCKGAGERGGAAAINLILYRNAKMTQFNWKNL